MRKIRRGEKTTAGSRRAIISRSDPVQEICSSGITRIPAICAVKKNIAFLPQIVNIAVKAEW
jgi:hypothetical protein